MILVGTFVCYLFLLMAMNNEGTKPPMFLSSIFVSDYQETNVTLIQRYYFNI